MTSPALLEALRNSPFGFPDAEGPGRFSLLLQRRKVAKSRPVFVEGETGGSFFLVASGGLKAFRALAGGKTITVFRLIPGECFGLLPLLGGGPYALLVEAVEASVTHVLERPVFLNYLKEDGGSCALLMANLARRLGACLDQVGFLGRHGALERAAQGLLSPAPGGSGGATGVEVVLPFSQGELARTLPLAPENLSRALAKLRRRGRIGRAGKAGSGSWIVRVSPAFWGIDGAPPSASACFCLLLGRRVRPQIRPVPPPLRHLSA